MSPALAMHSAETVEWATPHRVVELARSVLGSIDGDPCSSAYWNEHVVKAPMFYTSESDPHPFKIENWSSTKNWLINPPGKMVKEFWRFGYQRWARGGAVFFVGFSLEQLLYLQNEGLFFEGFIRCLPRSRIRYLKKVEGGPPVPGPAPTHGSFFCLLPSSNEQVERFRVMAREFGEVF